MSAGNGNPAWIVAGKCEACWAENCGEGCDWAVWGATCDWGNCDGASVTMRWDDRLKQWLPVCADHAPDRRSRCAALPPHHQPRECE